MDAKLRWGKLEKYSWTAYKITKFQILPSKDLTWIRVHFRMVKRMGLLKNSRIRHSFAMGRIIRYWIFIWQYNLYGILHSCTFTLRRRHWRIVSWPTWNQGKWVEQQDLGLCIFRCLIRWIMWRDWRKAKQNEKRIRILVSYGP